MGQGGRVVLIPEGGGGMLAGGSDAEDGIGDDVVAADEAMCSVGGGGE